MLMSFSCSVTCLEPDTPDLPATKIHCHNELEAMMEKAMRSNSDLETPNPENMTPAELNAFATGMRGTAVRS